MATHTRHLIRMVLLGAMFVAQRLGSKEGRAEPATAGLDIDGYKTVLTGLLVAPRRRS